MSDIYLPITYDADDKPTVHQPHTTEAGARTHAQQLVANDDSVVSYEICTAEVIIDE